MANVNLARDFQYVSHQTLCNMYCLKRQVQHALLCLHLNWGHGLHSLYGSGLGDKVQWAFQRLSLPAEDITDVDLHTPPASHSLMRLSECAEKDSYLIHASRRARGARPSESASDKSRRGKCQACQTGTGQQTAFATPHAQSLTRGWLD